MGADFFARWVVDGSPRGVVDRIEDLGHPGLDREKIAPEVVAFFEDTAGLDLHIRSRWRFPFSIGWWLVRPILRWIGQLVYPNDEARIVTRALALDPEADGRSDARAIIRTYVDTGDVMQAVSYATWEREGTRYMSAAFPLPFGRLMGILRLDPLEKGAVFLTSRGGDAGVWYVLGSLAIPMPFGERLELAPSTGDPEATILGRHEQRIFGIRVVTHQYRFWPSRGPRSKT